MNWRPEIVFRPENGQPVYAARFGDGAIAILVPEHGLAFSIFVVLKISVSLLLSKVKVSAVRFENLCLSHGGILPWGNLINTNS